MIVFCGYVNISLNEWAILYLGHVVSCPLIATNRGRTIKISIFITTYLLGGTSSQSDR